MHNYQKLPNLVVKILMYIKRFYVSCKIMHSSCKTQICMNQNGLCKRFLKISSELIIVHTKVRIKYYARFWSARKWRHEGVGAQPRNDSVLCHIIRFLLNLEFLKIARFGLKQLFLIIFLWGFIII